jgi:DNA-binding NarL/FixJ family response regulator
MKLIIVDDNETFRKTLKFYLEIELKHEIIAEASSGEEFLELENVYKADVILMDIMMGNMDGFNTSKKILFEFPMLKIIAITMHAEQMFLIHLLQSGFKGFVNKTDVYLNIATAINEVAQGKMFFPDNIKIDGDT